MQIIRVTQIFTVFITAIKLDAIDCERTGKGSGAFIKYEFLRFHYVHAARNKHLSSVANYERVNKCTVRNSTKLYYPVILAFF